MQRAVAGSLRAGQLAVHHREAIVVGDVERVGVGGQSAIGIERANWYGNS